MEALCDPLNDRFIKTLKPPPHKPLSSSVMYPDASNYEHANTILKFSIDNANVPDLGIIRQHLLDQGTVAKPELVKLLKDTLNVFSNSYIYA